MSNQQSGVPEIDLLAIRDALKLRWWIVPVVMLVSVGFLFINESNLATEPGYIQISRTYEARDEAAVLTVAGIDPGSIIPYPSFDNQLAMLRSSETKAKIDAELGFDTSVSISRTEQKFSLVDTVEAEGKTRFTFLSVGVPSYGFACAAPVAETCDTAINAYVAELSSLRKSSVREGFTRAEALLSQLESAKSTVSDQLLMQRDALAYAKNLVTGEIKLISTATENIGPTITNVKTSTYIFGMGVGALLGLLIILQVTTSDRKIRTLRKLKSAIGNELAFGELKSEMKGAEIQSIAAAIAFAAASNNATNVRLVPIDDSVKIAPIMSALSQALTGNPLTILDTKVIHALGAGELLAPAKSLVVLVARARSSRTDVLEHSIAVLEHAGNKVAGVILSN